RRLLVVDLVYWSAFAIYQGTFALFCARRFGFDVPHTGYVLSVFGVLGVLVQVGLVPRVVGKLGERRAFVLGLLLAAIGCGGAAMAGSVPLFLLSLVPAGIGGGLCTPSMTSLISRQATPEEQGSVQGAASALESLGRAIGPVWGNGVLQLAGAGAAFGSGALMLASLALVMGGPAASAEAAGSRAAA